MPGLFPTPISKPFDPSNLKVEVKNTTIEHLITMLKNDLIDLQPDFQRRGNLWSEREKGSLIESIILGLPLPSFYFYIDNNIKKWIVIDGLQRLCALKDFMVTQELKLSELQLLGNTHNGKTYDDFSYFEQLDMTMRPVTLNVISGTASKEAMYIIFQRLNSQGTQLTSAEIRNAVYHGPAMEFIKKLAKSDAFKVATSNSISEKRLKPLDYVSRFVAFYMQGYKAYENDKMDTFIGNALNSLNQDQREFNTIEKTFERSLLLCHKLLGSDTFRQPKAQSGRNNPISISLFEATMYAVSQLTSAECDILLKRKDFFHSKYASMFNDIKVKKHLSNGTNKYQSVETRFTVIEKTIKDSIYD